MCAEVCMASVKDSLESPRWTPAIMGVRTGESNIGLVCGNDGSEDLPHAHKTITVSLHGYSHESDFYCNCFILWKGFKVESIFYSN